MPVRRLVEAGLGRGEVSRGPSWGQVLATTISLWATRRLPRFSVEWHGRGPAGPGPVPGTSAKDPPEPSWGRVLATTVSLWASRRLPRVSVEWPPRAGEQGRSRLGQTPGQLLGPSAPGPPRAARSPTARRPYARLVAASMLGAGLLAVGAGTAGLVVAGASPASAVRLPARPSPVPVPSGRTTTSVSQAAVQRTAGPVWLTIPAIGVRAKVVDLGLNPNGTLQVPASTTVVGWYTGSPPPGATGSAVIAGHVDSRAGLGVFFWLRTMRPGERIYVRRSDGTLAPPSAHGHRST